jgi:hypothetical protein
VTVKGYVDQVAIVAGDQVVARHPRCYGQGELQLDPLHYLAALGRKPAALDHANVFRHWELPAIFGELRQTLEKQHGAKSGGRQFIRVLQLLAHHAVERVARAVEMSRSGAGFDVAAILRRASSGQTQETPSNSDRHALVDAVAVPLPDLRLFDRLLTLEEKRGSEYRAADQEQPETTAAAGDACRV